MVDQVAEVVSHWVEAPVSSEGLTLEVLRKGVDWLKGDFRNRWNKNLRSLESLKDNRGKEMLKICTELANLQRDLAYYLFLVSQNRDFLRELEKPVREALFGEGRDSVVNVLGMDRRGFVEGSLAGAISNLTFWRLITESKQDLAGRLDFAQMIVGGELDARYAIDAVLDFGTKTKGGKKVLRLVQLKTDRSGQVVANEVHPNDLKTEYLGGSVTKKDAERMIEGARERYPDYYCRFFAVCVPSFDSPPVRNAFGIIHPGYPGRKILIDQFKKEAERIGLLPN